MVTTTIISNHFTKPIGLTLPTYFSFLLVITMSMAILIGEGHQYSVINNTPANHIELLDRYGNPNLGVTMIESY
jgi:hypothetical protein